MRERQRWLDAPAPAPEPVVSPEAEEAKQTLAATQGPAQTFHEQQGTTGPGVPGTGLQPAEHRAQHQPKVGEEGEQPIPDPQVYGGEEIKEGLAEVEEPKKENEPRPRPFAHGKVADSLASHVESAALEGGPGEPIAFDTAIPKPSRTRPEDQRLPVASGAPISHRLVQDDLEARLQVGIQRYGQPLQAHNGRNSFQDAFEEVLDLSVYLKTLQVEREYYAEVLRDLLAETDRTRFAERGQGIVEQVIDWLEQ
jgi:hypothetical protein